MTIALVVDDSQEMADSLCEMLKYLGIRAYPAYGPRAAMLALQRISPDVVFLDINMPGVDGFEVMAYLRRYPSMTNVPVIIVTSDDQPETAGRARRTGALLLIVKPVTLESLEGALKKAGLIR
jgi:CheY-like chemotaxis protein